jgi:hypothetical protein
MMTDRRLTVIGGGVRTERHNPDIVAKVIEAKAKAAQPEETVEVVSRLDALKRAEREAHENMAIAHQRLKNARDAYDGALLLWGDAMAARKEEEKNGNRS